MRSGRSDVGSPTSRPEGARSETPAMARSGDTTTDLVHRVPLLASLSEEDIRSLAPIAGRRSFRHGHTIFREGEPGDSLYILIRGSVFITMLSSDGAESILAVLRGGDCLGELSLLDGFPRSATARAAEDVDALVVTRDHFQSWLADHHAASLALLRTLSMRIRRTNAALADRNALDLWPRLAKQLLLLADDQPRTSASEGPDLRVTQQQLAEMLGVTREAVNKTLREFAQAGWIELRRGIVRISDAASLAEQL